MDEFHSLRGAAKAVLIRPAPAFPYSSMSMARLCTRLGRTALLTTAFATLTGCIGTGTEGQSLFAGLTGGTERGAKYKPAVRQVTLANGAITVPSPAGFCFDPKTLRRSSSNSFAILASCAALGAGPDFDASVITITVSARQPDLTDPGLGALVEATRAQGILAQNMRDGIAIVQLAKGGNSHIKKADPKHWRATFMLNERLIGLAALGAPNGLLLRNAGGKTLEQLARAIRKHSPAKPESAPSKAKPATKTKLAPEPSAKKALASVIGRLFQGNHLAKD